MPVNEPGPIVTAIRSRAAKPPSRARPASSTIGASASACPRAIGRLRTASGSTRPASTTATDAAPQDVSMARMRIAQTLDFRIGEKDVAGRADPFPSLLGTVARSAGWVVGRRFGPGRIARPSPQIDAGPYLLSAPHPALGHLPRIAEKGASLL